MHIRLRHALISLIGDPRKAFLAAEHLQHVEDAGRRRLARQRRAQAAARYRRVSRRSLRIARARRPRSTPRSTRAARSGARAARPDARAPWRRASAAFGSMTSGRCANRKSAPSSSSTSVFARAFRPGMAALQLRAFRVVEGGELGRAVRQPGQGVDQRLASASSSSAARM